MTGRTVLAFRGGVRSPQAYRRGGIRHLQIGKTWVDRAWAWAAAGFDGSSCSGQLRVGWGKLSVEAVSRRDSRIGGVGIGHRYGFLDKVGLVIAPWGVRRVDGLGECDDAIFGFRTRSIGVATSLACAGLGPLVTVGVLGVILEIYDGVEGERASRVGTGRRLHLVRRESELVLLLEPVKMPVQMLLPGQFFRELTEPLVGREKRVEQAERAVTSCGQGLTEDQGIPLDRE